MKHYLKYVFCRFILFGIFFTFTTGELTAQVLWEKDPGNPVFIPGEPGKWDDAWVSYPVVIHDGTRFIMYYTGCPEMSDVGAQIGRATSPDGINWTREQNNPIILRGLSGKWDDGSVLSGPVLFDGSEYKMWYGGYDGSQYRIGLATSPDGIVWTKYSEENPVLDVGDPGEWDDRNVWTLCVIFDGSIYKIWYCGGDQATKIYRVGYATSSDGITWDKYDDPETTNPPYAESDPVLDVGDPGEWDDTRIWNCYVYTVTKSMRCGMKGMMDPPIASAMRLLLTVLLGTDMLKIQFCLRNSLGKAHMLV